MTPETVIKKRIMAECSKHGAVVWINSTGSGFMDSGHYVKYGLCKGSSDLIGITKDGRFLAIEVKQPGRYPTREQILFIEFIRKMGGLAGVARKESDVEDILGGKV